MHHSHSTDDSYGRGAHFHHGPFGKDGIRGPFGMPGHPGFGGFGGMRARRGDIRSAILRLLAESPMHGYQMIQELSARSGGAWSPSPGSVYPALQMLADEGLVSAEETAGKKVFSLTEAGLAEVAKTADQPAPWEDAAQDDSGFGDYRQSAGKLLHVVFQIGKNGTTEQRTAALEILNDARKKLYTILAED
ncbi:MAG: PadR family transcriptional regulator [Actinobacteria bacterium HGW-Actinobacteria-1]|jgi:DNA-binding PadR family transcriptional regulator|nr:MAG: PadR family transcriptional regulator [Actinobacteria bacterium HGW-Actinobacteria-1]